MIIPKLVGLKMCFPLIRNIYLDEILRTAANAADATVFVFSIRHKLKEEMIALLREEESVDWLKIH